MSDETKPRTERRWTAWQLVGILAGVWLLAILLFFVLTAQP